MSTTAIPAIKRSARAVAVNDADDLYVCGHDDDTVMTRQSKIIAVHGKQLKSNPDLSAWWEMTKNLRKWCSRFHAIGLNSDYKFEHQI